MYNSDLASDIEKAVQDALATSDFSKLNKNITTAVNTSIAQIGTSQNRFYQQYDNQETTAEDLERIDGEIVNGDMRADYKARRQAAQAEAERARYNSRQAIEARRKAAEERRRQAAEEARKHGGGHGAAHGSSNGHGHHSYQGYSSKLREAAEAFGFFGGSAAKKTNQNGGNFSENTFRMPGQNPGYTNRAATAHSAHSPAELVPISRNPKGRVSGILLSVFGWLGLATCMMLFMMFNLFSGSGDLSYHTYDTLMSSLVVPGFLVSGGMTIIGTKRRHRIHRFYQYVRQLRGRAYCPIKELSSHIGRSQRFVLKDLRKMIALGMFPEGHIDDQQTCVMLNGATYDQYLKVQNAYLARQLEKKRAGNRIDIQAANYGTDSTPPQNISGNDAGSQNRAEQKSSLDTPLNSGAENKAAENPGRASLPPKVIKVLSAGDSYLTKIREANAAIPGEVISAKLDHLEEIIRKIYARIELHPEQVDDLDKFINYYLPTTLKLVDAYKDFEAQSVKGDNIQSAKKEIESTLETIIYAFETLLDSLYEDDALDISTDISVLQTMFAQEGLTKGAFDKM